MTKRRIRGKILAVYGQVLVEGLDGWLPDYGRLGLDWIGNLIQVIEGFATVHVRSDFRYVGSSLQKATDDWHCDPCQERAPGSGNVASDAIRRVLPDIM